MEIRVFAPDATSVRLTSDSGDRPLDRHGDHWVGEVELGQRYGLIASGPPGTRFRDDRTLVDPEATEVWFHDEHRRDAARPGAGPNHRIAPRAVATEWPAPRPQHHTSRPLVVHEVHVRGMTRRRERVDAGTYLALIDELPRLGAVGVSVIELLPVHQFDPDEGNYWGYMPMVFGAVHRQYAAGDDANRELGDLVAAAHAHDIEVWLDVVFNHTTEEDEAGPTYNLRGLADARWYALHDDGFYVDDAGCGNIVDTHSSASRELIMSTLDRFADLGVDGFRFDLATVLGRHPDFVRSIGDWAADRGVRLVAEAWDVVRYQVGRSWPDPRWMQWNGRYRDDMRGFLRGEAGLVPAVMQRLQGSPDLFDAPWKSVNFLTAHDGFTMFDLVAHDRKHNDANGWNGTDGTDDNRSWNCGWEGEAGASDEVRALRRRQLRNAWTLLMLSHGTPMAVSGDEFGRTQGGNNNPYNQDDETTWTDWSRRNDWLDLERFVQRLTDFRAAHPVLTQVDWWGSDVEWFGVSGAPDCGDHSRSLAWHLDGLYVMVNMWWEPLDFAVQAPGPWRRMIDTADESGFAEPSPAGSPVVVAPRSIVVLADAAA
ncbi:MAG: alpha-amylase family glycosyl hydrolase [Ilumatobacter sp.]|uniref:alpha-amylase family glycosyl hydrolase n=1 Tax=Ilumatobacter sp. TaxID=1967498 RepID=UPI0032995FCF